MKTKLNELRNGDHGYIVSGIPSLIGEVICKRDGYISLERTEQNIFIFNRDCQPWQIVIDVFARDVNIDSIIDWFNNEALDCVDEDYLYADQKVAKINIARLSEVGQIIGLLQEYKEQWNC